MSLEPIWSPRRPTAAPAPVRRARALWKAACQQLPAGYRVVLSLYLFEGYDMEEIASILNIRPASVRSQYLRGKRKLLEQLTKR